MTEEAPLLQDLAEARDKSLAGGKAVNLGVLLRAGFPVPGGFVLTTAAYHAGRHADLRRRDTTLAEMIVAAWRKLGGVPVAVRSSATAEDMADASMAGQYETFLDVDSENELLGAVQKCWASLDSPRTRSYLAEHGIDLSRVAMAVVVQRLVPADVAGVLFTANPQTGSRREMLIEASWGLGEMVVSGRVQPDVLRVERGTGRVVQSMIADKQVWLRPGSHEDELVEEPRRRIACLKSADVDRLWKLGRRAAEQFNSEQDLEWAIAGGELFLLQSRPITTLAHAESFEHVLQSTRARLRNLVGQGRGPWVMHNIGETLKHPTSLTWSVIRRFMSGDGGYGRMYGLVGFEPAAGVRRDGFLERVAGRAYMDCAVASEMFFAGYPFRYDVDELRRNPDAANAPPTVPAGTLAERMAVARKVAAVGEKTRALARDFDTELTKQVIPEFVAWCTAERSRDLARLPAEELIATFEERERRVLAEFGPQSLLPSMISAMALADLRTFLEEHFWDDDADAAAALIASSHDPDKTLLANAALWEVAHGTRTTEQWLAEFGHRAPDEFDLATPRWRERPDELATMASRLKGGPNPLDLQKAHHAKAEEKASEIRSTLPRMELADFESRLALARRYLPFRETGKYYLMLGYDLLRDCAVECGRRLDVGDGVFHLSNEELFDAIRIGFAPNHLIHERRLAYEAESKLPLPSVIDADAIEHLGAPQPGPARDGVARAFPVSTGVAAGPARIVRSPSEAGDLGTGYVLVCPSTDPGWTPLFVNAAALIIECGGTLSHGAVVAREMNIPAVVLPGATAMFADGERIAVDGRHGSVSRELESAAAAPAPPEATLDYQSQRIPRDVRDVADPNDVRIPRQLVPPPPGRTERRANAIRNGAAGLWAVFLLAIFILPERWLYRPIFDVLDAILWPLVRLFGKPWTVAIVAAAVAAGTMLVQRLLTDNARLREARRRATLLQKLAASHPIDSPRRRAMLALAAPVQMRIVGASFVPLAVLLGPMILTFLWFPPRVDPAAWNAAPGSEFRVVATVDADVRHPVRIELPPGLTLHEMDRGAERKLDPIRETLEGLLAEWQRPTDLSKYPWDLQAAANLSRKLMLDDLRDYLDRGVPPQQLVWRVTPTTKDPGRWDVTVKVPDADPVALHAVLGDRHPPSESLKEPDHGPIRSVKIEYAKPPRPQAFWTPLGLLRPIVGQRAWTHWDFGWLGLYLAVYLPVMFTARRLLKVV